MLANAAPIPGGTVRTSLMASRARDAFLRKSTISMAKNGAEGDQAVALSLSMLSSHLWEAANILRGPVDAADFKTYIFPLLFFKRISDVYDDELAEAMTLSGGDQQFAQFPENHRFQIPDGFHWEDVRAKTSNIGRHSNGRCVKSRKPIPTPSMASLEMPAGRIRSVCQTLCSAT